MSIKYAKGAFNVRTEKWILSFGKCWLDGSFGWILFPAEGEVIIKKMKCPCKRKLDKF